MSVALRIIYEEDLAVFHIHGLDKQTGFLAESVTRDLIASDFKRKRWTFIKKLATLFATLRLTTVIHETQCPNLVGLLPEEIELTNVFPTEMMSLCWVVKQRDCRVTSLTFTQ